MYAIILITASSRRNMEILNWIISQEVSHKLRTSHIWIITILVIAIAYPIGYLLIDVLDWISLTPEQLQNGFQHIARYLVGAASLVLPIMLLTLFDSDKNL